MKLPKINENTIFFLLLGIDLIFVILHIVHIGADNIWPGYKGLFSNPNWSIEQDKGYSEIVQYFKEFVIMMTLFLLFRRKRQIIYLAWAFLFFYLLLDDSLRFHENIGRILSVYFDFPSIMGLRPKDLGETLVLGTSGLFLLSFVGIAYYVSETALRRISHYLLLLVIALAFFGVVVDLGHIIATTPIFQRLLGGLEDGGELLIMDIIVWYILKLYWQQPDNTPPVIPTNEPSLA